MSSLVKIICSLILVSAVLRLNEAQSTEWERKILDAHNNYRRTVYPPGSNLNELAWDSSLATLAAKFVAKCFFEHSSSSDRTGGENIAKTGYEDPIRLSMLWFDERKWFNYNATPGVCKPTPSGTCGHYVMIVRDEISQLGCAQKLCDGSYLTFCEFDRGPKSVEPYKKGASCSSCPLSKPFCRGGLCVAAKTDDCRLTCKNCGTFNKDTCTCTCPAASLVNDCSDIPSSGTCGQCQKLGTPCLNNGTDPSSGEKCSCSCKAEFVGPFCQVLKIELDSAVALQIRGPLNDGATYPISPLTFNEQIFPLLKKEIIQEVKEFCIKTPSSCGETNIATLDEKMLKALPTLTSSMKDGRMRCALVLDLGSGKYFPQESLLTVLQSVTSKSKTLQDQNITLASLKKADPSLFIDSEDPDGGSGLPAIIIILIVLFALLVAGFIAMALILKFKPNKLNYVVNYVYDHGGPNKSPRPTAQVTPAKPR